jgi:peptide/nickel transport system substrate-binding protein
MSMKNKSYRTKKLPLLFLTAALLLTACSKDREGSASSGTPASAPSSAPSSESASETVPEAPVPGGALSYGLASSPDSLDPHVSGLDVASRVMRNLYDSLVSLTPDNRIEPWLATEWSLSPDNKSYTFKLRQDVKFHDGTPFDAEAVKFNFDRIVDPATEASIALSYLSLYESSEVLDPYTLRIHLKSVSASFLRDLSLPSLGIESPAAIRKHGKQVGRQPVGTGPFRFVKWDENSAIELERNPDYAWAPGFHSNPGQPYLERVVFRIIPEEATRIASLQSGQAHAIEGIPPQNVAALKNDPAYTLIEQDSLGLPFSLFINERTPPWNELKARQALQLAIDFDSIVQSLYLGTYKRAWSPLTPSTFGYDSSLENAFAPDPEQAAKLLDELGWKPGADGIREKDGNKLTLRYVESLPNREKRNEIAAIIQQQLKAVGVSVEVNLTQDVSTVVLIDKAYDLFGSSNAALDPNSLKTFYHTDGLTGWPSLSGFDDPELDRLLEQGEVELDDAKRDKIYKEIQRKIIDNAVVLPLYVHPFTVASSTQVRGLAFNALGYPLLNEAFLEK